MCIFLVRGNTAYWFLVFFPEVGFSEDFFHSIINLAGRQLYTDGGGGVRSARARSAAKTPILTFHRLYFADIMFISFRKFACVLGSLFFSLKKRR
jgi:hypothetical protein